jgi:predicted nuclease with TOPRIM domain
MKNIDIRTLLLIGLSVVIIGMIFFSTNEATTDYSIIADKHEQIVKEKDAIIEELQKDVEKKDEENKELEFLLDRSYKTVDELTEKVKKDLEEIKRLKSGKGKVSAQVDASSDEQREKLWRENLEKKKKVLEAASKSKNKIQ